MDNTRKQQNNIIGFESLADSVLGGKIKSGNWLVLNKLCILPFIASVIFSSIYLVVFTDIVNQTIPSDYLKSQIDIMVVFSSFSMVFMICALMIYVIVPMMIKSRFYTTQFFFHEENLNIRYIDETLHNQEVNVDYYDIRYIKIKTASINDRKPKTLLYYFLNGYLNKSQQSGVIDIHTRKKGVIKCCFMDLVLSDSALDEFQEQCRIRRIKV